MRLSGTKTGSANQYNGLGDQLYDLGGARPTLDLNFASNGSLVDSVTGKTLVDHTRASSATYVDGDGVIRTAVTNFALYSEDLTQNVYTTNGSITATIDTTQGEPFPNAQVTKVVFSGVDESINQAGTYDNKPRTFSLWIKGVAGETIRVFAKGGLTPLDHTLSGSWERISVSLPTPGGTGSYGFGTFGDQTARTVYVSGLQFEQSSTVGEYVKTTTAINSAPRFDHKVTRTTTNLAIRSEEFDTWSAVNANVSADQITAPDGLTTADLTEATATAAYAGRVTRAVTGLTAGNCSISVYAKAGNSNFVAVGFVDSGSGNTRGYFDLSTRTSSSSSTAWTVNNTDIQDAGNGWYRCIMEIDADPTDGSADFQIYPVDGLSTNDVTSGNSVYLWGAQLEQNSDVGPYVKTEASTATKVDAEPLGLLVEESRTNEFTGNDNIPSAFTGGATRTSVSILTPDGNASGHAMLTDASAFPDNYENLTTSGTNNEVDGTLSFYAKKKTTGTATLTVTMEGGGVSRGFYSGAINSDTWTRVTATKDYAGATSLGRRWDIFLPSGSSSDGNTEFYICFVQFENGSFPTSYIRTTGSTVTRSADVTSIEGNDFGTFNLVEYSEEFDQLTQTYLSVTPNAITAPDGKLTADKLVLTDTGHAHAEVYSGTVSASNAYGYINLNTGVSIKQSGSWNGSTTTDVGNGWWHITVTSDSNYTLSFYAKKGEVDYATWQLFNVARIGVSDTSHIINSSGSGGAYVWGAQLEESSTATPYVKSDVTWTSRASNATYYDYTGTLKKSSYNLLPYSEDITNADWTIFGTATRSANTTTAPDGTTTADSITLPVGSGIYDSRPASANTTYTFSVYIKGTPGTSLRILINPNVSGFVYETVNVTDNWVRYNVTHTTGASDTAASFQFDTGGGGTFYVWGAQAETGPYAGDYVKTEGSAASSARNVAFLPDGSGNFVSAGELLLEDAGTNFIPTSEPATGSNLAGTTNSLVSDITTPDGQVSTVRQVTLRSTYRFGSTSAGTAGTTYTGSIWIRTVSGTGTVTLDVNDDNTVSCDLTETWQRFDVTGTHATQNYRFFDVTGNDLSVYLWGAQLETGSYATSYIPTYGSSATRAADVSSSSSNTFGNSFYNQSEGTVFSDANFTNNVSYNTVFNITNGTSSERVRTIQWNDASSNRILSYRSSNTDQANFVGTSVVGKSKNAGAYKTNDFAGVQDGGSVQIDSSGDVSTSVTLMFLGSTTESAFILNGHISRFTYWPSRLSNDTLQTITQ